jgi:protein-disulfide isomerase
MSSRLESFMSWVLTISAMVIAGVLVHREFSDRQEGFRTPSPNDPPTFVKDWEMLPSGGVVVGGADAPVMIVEFSDLECPFCRKFHEVLEGTRRSFGDSVAYTFVHYPLPGHQNAYPAARAAECANSQGRFHSFVTAIFAGQDSLGKKTWSAYAREAMVPDSTAFATCVADTTRVDRIDRGRALGALLKVRGTPTVIVNGWQFPTPPSDSQMRRIVMNVLRGKKPQS